MKWCTNDEDLLITVIVKIGDKFQMTVGESSVNTKNKNGVDFSEAKIDAYPGLRY